MTKLAFVLDNGRELQIPLAADLPLGRLVEVTAAVQDVELLHQERLQSLGLLSAHHDRVATEVEQITGRYHEVSAEVHRLQAVEAELRHELQTLAARKEQALTTLQQLSGRQAVEESHLKSLEGTASAVRQFLRETTSAADLVQADLRAATEKLAQAQEQQTQIHADVAARTSELLQTEERLQKVQMQHDVILGRLEMLATACEDLASGNEQFQQIQIEIEARIASLTAEEQSSRQAADVAQAAHREAAELHRQTDVRLHACKTELDSKRLELASRTEELLQLTTTLECRRDEASEAETQLSTLILQMDGCRRQLDETSTQLAARQDEHVRLVNEVGTNQGKIAAQQIRLETMRLEQKEAENTLASLREQDCALKTRIEALAAAEKTQKERYQELRSLTDAAENEHVARLKAHEERLLHTQQELHEVENRLEALEAWNQRMNECQARLTALPADSLEARNLRNDIEVSMAALRHLLSKRAFPVSPPALHPRADSRPPLSSEGTLAAEKALHNETSGDGQVPNSRFESMRQERRYPGLRPRVSSQNSSSLEEHERNLEDKIRQNEARLALLERRLKRGELDERSQHEKIASLRQQLAGLADEITRMHS
jgi:chromosome segregation ATPase